MSTKGVGVVLTREQVLAILKCFHNLKKGGGGGGGVSILNC